MADQEYRQLSREELNELAGEELPERAAMSLVNANLAIPVNVALAANVLSGDHALLDEEVLERARPRAGCRFVTVRDRLVRMVVVVAVLCHSASSSQCS